MLYSKNDQQNDSQREFSGNKINTGLRKNEVMGEGEWSDGK